MRSPFLKFAACRFDDFGGGESREQSDDGPRQHIGGVVHVAVQPRERHEHRADADDDDEGLGPLREQQRSERGEGGGGVPGGERRAVGPIDDHGHERVHVARTRAHDQGL